MCTLGSLGSRVCHRIWPALTVLVLSSFALPLHAQYYKLETAHLRMLVPSSRQTYLVPHVMRSFENAYRFETEFFNYKPREKVALEMTDRFDFGNGGATSVPLASIEIGIAPFSYAYETNPTGDRLKWMLSHEFAHIEDQDASARRDRLFRRMFLGKVAPSREDPLTMGYTFLTTPRRYAPRWFHEGTAVFMETWLNGGLGRGLGGWDEMTFRAMVRDGHRIFDVVGLSSEGTAADFMQGANAYMYGTRFINYLAATYGPEKVVRWISRKEDSRVYFSNEFQQVYGRSLQSEWRQWIDSERTWQQQNLAEIRKYPVTKMTRLSDQKLGWISRPYYDETNGRLYAGVKYKGTIPHLAVIDVDTGKITKLHDVEGGAMWTVCSLAFDRVGRKLFYTTDNAYWRELHVYDLTTGRSRRLIRGARVGDLAFNPADKSLWGVRHRNGQSFLVHIPPPYTEIEPVVAFAYGADLYDLDVSPDGRFLVAAKVKAGQQSLIRYRTANLLAGNIDAETLHDFGFTTPSNFVYSPDGRYLYGSSYETGVANVYRLDVATRTLEILTNSETGLFQPIPLAGGRVIAMEYTADGFLPVRLEDLKPLEDVNAVKYLGQQVVEKYPIVKSWKLPSEASIDLAQLTTAAGPYRPLREMTSANLYPVVQGYKDAVAPGARLDLRDPFGMSVLRATASYSPTAGLSGGERFHFGFNYRYKWAYTLSGYYNNADFYDLFGPTKTSRKGTSLKLAGQKWYRFEPPGRRMWLDWSLAGYLGLDRLPDYQNVTASVSRMMIGKAALNYSYLERSLGAVDDEKGYFWKVGAEIDYAAAHAYPQFTGGFDYGFLTPLHNSPIWIRSSAGRAFGDRSSPFANVYFGGFGNNYLDKLDADRYREYYSFPGVELNAIEGHDYARSLVEWQLPPIRFAHLGTLFLYCNWARLSLFSSGLLTNIGQGAASGLYGNAGAQVDFNIVLFSYLNSTFSVGYAQATDRQGHLSNEVMLSLKIL